MGSRTRTLSPALLLFPHCATAPRTHRNRIASRLYTIHRPLIPRLTNDLPGPLPSVALTAPEIRPHPERPGHGRASEPPRGARRTMACTTTPKHTTPRTIDTTNMALELGRTRRTVSCATLIGLA